MKLGNETTSRKVKVFAELWALAWVVCHPRWKSQGSSVDWFYHLDGFDLNLFAEGGRLSVCAYPLVEFMGETWVEWENCIYLVEKGRVR